MCNHFIEDNAEVRIMLLSFGSVDFEVAAICDLNRIVAQPSLCCDFRQLAACILPNYFVPIGLSSLSVLVGIGFKYSFRVCSTAIKHLWRELYVLAVPDAGSHLAHCCHRHLPIRDATQSASIAESDEGHKIRLPRSVKCFATGRTTMTVEAWSIIASAVNSGLLIVGGLWLKHFVDQQVKAKDAIIALKESEISRLKDDRAPAIAEAYAKMRDHANQVTREAAQVQEKLSKLTAHKDRVIESLPALTLAFES